MGIKNNHELSIYIPESEFISRMRREWQSVEPEKVEQPIDPMRFQAAVAAMQGILASYPNDRDHTFQEVADQIAKVSVCCADSLISALKGGGK